jgi:hypothetical protein
VVLRIFSVVLRVIKYCCTEVHRVNAEVTEWDKKVFQSAYCAYKINHLGFIILGFALNVIIVLIVINQPGYEHIES